VLCAWGIGSSKYGIESAGLWIHFLSDGKVDDLGCEFVAGAEVESSDGDRKVEAARAAGAGVEVEDAFFCIEVWDVGVAVENGGKFGGRGIEVEGFEVVEHVEVDALVRRVLDENDVGFGEIGAGAVAIDVAADGGDGSDFGELVEDGDFADVADVEDAVDTVESGDDFRAEQAMGVRDDAKFQSPSSRRVRGSS